jgi:hypothetical protein
VRACVDCARDDTVPLSIPRSICLRPCRRCPWLWRRKFNATSANGPVERAVGGRHLSDACHADCRSQHLRQRDNPTTVTHTAAGTDLSLSHAGSTYRGTIDTSGRFTSPAANFAFPDADYAIGLTGQFSTTGFTATVELTKRAGGTTCTYAVAWVGTKSGSPNTIPN